MLIKMQIYLYLLADYRQKLTKKECGFSQHVTILILRR